VPTLAATVTRFAVMPVLAASISRFTGGKATARCEKDLVALAREGDQRAIFRLFSLHQKRIYALSFSFLKNAPAAESLTQEIFLNAFRRLKDLCDDAAFSTFISRSLWKAVLKFKSTSQETSSSAVELAASNFQTASAALTQLEA
jgi:DNA-directed RNA polymerase specialized sigma24 family protein